MFGFGSLGLPPGGRVPAVSPSQQLLNLATADGWTALYDPTNPDTRTLNGATVSDLADGLGNKETLSQATAGNQPTFEQNAFGRLDGMDFDGGDWLDTGALSAAITQPNFTLALVKHDTGVHTGATEDNIYDGNGTGRQLALISGGDQWRMFAGTNVSVASPVPTAAATVVGSLFNGASSEIFINGTSAGVISVGTNALNGLIVGSRITGNSSHWNGRIGAILLFDGTPTAAVRNGMTNLIKQLAGI